MPTLTLTVAQIQLINSALSHRTGPHPCDVRPELALSTFEVVLDALAPTAPTCGAADHETTSCESAPKPRERTAAWCARHMELAVEDWSNRRF